MNEKYALFIWSSFALGLAVLAWNWLVPYLARNDLHRRLSQAALEEREGDA